MVQQLRIPWNRAGWIAGVLVGVSLLAGSSFAATTAGSTLELPAATATRLTLDNGLVVLIDEDHAYPRVAFEVRVKGGSCDDAPWVGAGLAHLMEHMLFKGTARRPVGTIEPEVRRYEGNFNAFTSYDYTGFSLSVSSAYTREGLDLLGDALFHSSFDPEELKKEQEVVRGEMRMNRDDPDRRLYQRFWNAAFQVHPYRHPIIGYEEVFNRLHRDDVLAFYRQRYVPNNMVLAIVGDVETARVRQWVEELYGAVPRGIPLDWSRAQEPPQITTRRVIEPFPVQQAQLMLGFHSTRLQDAELYPLDVLAHILGTGESARLERHLRRERQLVHAISVWNSTPQDPGLFLVAATVDADKMTQATDAIIQELQQVCHDGVTKEELARAQQIVLAEYFQERQSLSARASDLATNELLVGDHEFSRKYVQGIRRVTTDDIRHAAQRHVRDEAWTLVALTPPSAPQPAAAQPASAAPHEALHCTRTTLKNGITVVTGAMHRTPLVSIRVLWHGGLRAETPETAGLSNLTAHLILDGTRQHSAEAIAALVENRGGELTSVSGRDGFGIALDLLASDATFGLQLLHELVTQATFPSDELERERRRALAQLRARDDDMFHVTGDRVRQLLLEEHPYARHPLGTRQTVERITAQECRTFFRQHAVPRDMVIAVVGDIEAQALMPLIERAFGSLPSVTGAPINNSPLRFPRSPVQDVVHLPERQQAVVALGYPGVAWSHPDRHALEVVEAVLSGSGGRLYQHIREHSGLSYTLGATHVPGELGGYLFAYVATTPGDVERVTHAMHQELAALAKTPPAAEEIELAKRTLREAYYDGIQQIATVASRAALDVLLGLGTEELERYPEQLARVSAQDVARVLREYLGAAAYAQVQTLPATSAASHRDAAPGGAAPAHTNGHE